MIISNETVYAGGYEPFGPSNATGTAKLYVRQKKPSARLVLSNAVISKTVVLDYSKGDDATWGGRQTIGYAANTTNVFLGPVTTPTGNAVDAFKLPASSTVIFAGGYGAPNKKFYVNWGTEGMVVISNKPFYASSWECNAKKLSLHCPGNTYTAMASWTSSDKYNAYATVPLSVDFHCDWAFDLPGTKSAFSGTWDLHGHDQRLGLIFASSSAVIQSFDGPATLHVNQECSKWRGGYPYVNGNAPTVPHPVPASQCRIRGEVSLHKTGPIEFALTNRVIEATGTVTVAEGPFTLCTGATWLGATNVVVTGTGVFNLSENGQLWKTTDFTLDGEGALNIPAGVVQKARFLWLDGIERAASPGVYGALDNASVPAKFRTARITGGGLLNVIGDGKGFILLFR